MSAEGVCRALHLRAKRKVGMEKGAYFGKMGKDDLKHPLQSPLLWFWNKEIFFIIYIHLSAQRNEP